MKLAQLVRVLIKRGLLFIRCQAAGPELGSALAVLELGWGMFLLNTARLNTSADLTERRKHFDVMRHDRLLESCRSRGRAPKIVPPCESRLLGTDGIPDPRLPYELIYQVQYTAYNVIR